MPLSTIYKDTDPVGTFFYMDPEYQRTGLVSPKSDTYALGMVILQLLTAKSPMGLALIVETALERDCLMDILDSKAGQWPKAEAKELAILGLSCLEMRRKDRPDLRDQVLPVLERLKAMAEQAYDSALQDPSVPPNHFICPILKTLKRKGGTIAEAAIEEEEGSGDKQGSINGGSGLRGPQGRWDGSSDMARCVATAGSRGGAAVHHWGSRGRRWWQ
ncbi:hypothetical protein BHE74_00024551 [Ensete ventricosum]|nr:hypothetical protein BHE74_00024551 [Ensete ventricosum]RZS02978.1 hypothetical protein BHM03_00033085 [Ensete ventricosum]